MAVGDRNVRFDVDEFTIRVTEEEAIKKAQVIDNLDPSDPDDVDKAAESVALQRFYGVATGVTGQVERSAARVVHEGHVPF